MREDYVEQLLSHHETQVKVNCVVFNRVVPVHPGTGTVGTCTRVNCNLLVIVNLFFHIYNICVYSIYTYMYVYDWIHERIDQSIHIGSRGLI